MQKFIIPRDGKEKQKKTWNFLDVFFIFVFSCANSGISPVGFVLDFFWRQDDDSHNVCGLSDVWDLKYMQNV